MTQIFRGNIQSVRKQIAEELDNRGSLSADQTWTGVNTFSAQLNLGDGSQARLVMSDTRTSGNQKGRLTYDGGTAVTGGGWIFQKLTDAGAFSENLVTIVQDTGYVGLGTITPSRRLHIVETTNGVDAEIQFGGLTDAGAQRSGWVGFDPDANFVYMANGAGGENRDIGVDSSGQVGIGTLTPSESLDVNGNVRVRGSLKIDGVTGDFYEEDSVVLGGDFDAGQSMIITRVGRLVTITTSATLTHPSSGSATSSGVVPASLRPANLSTNMYSVETVTGIFAVAGIQSNGALLTSYVDSSGSLVSRTDSVRPISITYSI